MHRISKRHKERAQRIHFQRRFSQRIGYVPDTVTCEGIIRQIKQGESVHLFDQSLRVKIKGVKVNGENVVVVYDKLRGSLVTVIPKDSVFYTDLERAYATR
ncbi:MAG TPA: hypothetical protein VLJ10_01755 [Candidatus Bathyarchaeia archaeon]|nr:hypothetical protein [Candidatus Bathyarchaeia archaeon]